MSWKFEQFYNVVVPHRENSSSSSAGVGTEPIICLGVEYSANNNKKNNNNHSTTSSDQGPSNPSLSMTPPPSKVISSASSTTQTSTSTNNQIASKPSPPNPPSGSSTSDKPSESGMPSGNSDEGSESPETSTSTSGEGSLSSSGPGTTGSPLPPVADSGIAAIPPTGPSPQETTVRPSVAARNAARAGESVEGGDGGGGGGSSGGGSSCCGGSSSSNNGGGGRVSEILNDEREGGGGSGGGDGVVPPHWTAFVQDVYSRYWFTYRKDFPPIGGSDGLTSDAGWGCCIRGGQMMLAQALLVHYLGREWRLERSAPPSPAYSAILRWFADKAAAPYSLAKIAQLGTKHDIPLGQWFGPNTICAVLASLMRIHSPDGLAVYVADSGTVYGDAVTTAVNELWDPPAPKTPEWHPSAAAGVDPPSWRPLFIMAPVRLGVAELNSVYEAGLARFFSWPQFVGIVGGKPRSARYFLAVQGSRVFYLDPHTVQPTVTMEGNFSSASYHCPAAGSMELGGMDPSLAIGFYVRDEADWNDLRTRLKAAAADPDHPVILSYADTTPNFADYDDADLDDFAMSSSEDEDSRSQGGRGASSSEEI